MNPILFLVHFDEVEYLVDQMIKHINIEGYLNNRFLLPLLDLIIIKRPIEYTRSRKNKLFHALDCSFIDCRHHLLIIRNEQIIENSIAATLSFYRTF